MKTARHILVLCVFACLSGCGERATAPQPTPVIQSDMAVEPPQQKSAPTELVGKVVKVVDGDTIDVLTNDRETVRIRLNGIDCPERGQPYGKNATEFMREAIGGQRVYVLKPKPFAVRIQSACGRAATNRFPRGSGERCRRKKGTSTGELYNLNAIRYGTSGSTGKVISYRNAYIRPTPPRESLCNPINCPTTSWSWRR